MLIVETAVIPGLYLIALVDFNTSNCDRKGQSYPVKYSLESVEEYSEGKIHMSEPESGNGNVNVLCKSGEGKYDERARDCKCLLRFELPA